MNKLYLIKNPQVFQGEKYLNNNKRYFEGWYFKNTNKEDGISFIPGINLNENERKAFIQIITNEKSYFINYNINDFQYSFDPFYIKIKDNFFSNENIHLNINDSTQNLVIYGDIRYSECKNIITNTFSPNIMGPFSYIPFLECNHAILSMKNKINGSITMNNKTITFNNDIGYIEKDWGYSFPKSYIWGQGNNFTNGRVSFMISIADIPFKFFSFRGIICSLIIDNKEYRFATYNNTRLIKYNINDNYMDIALKKGPYYLNVKSNYKNGLKLYAPIKGRMNKNIFESITTTIFVTLKRRNTIIFSESSINCGLEIVQK